MPSNQALPNAVQRGRQEDVKNPVAAADAMFRPLAAWNDPHAPRLLVLDLVE